MLSRVKSFLSYFDVAGPSLLIGECKLAEVGKKYTTCYAGIRFDIVLQDTIELPASHEVWGDARIINLYTDQLETYLAYLGPNGIRAISIPDRVYCGDNDG